MKWVLGPIDDHIQDIQRLFEENRGHKHEDNYILRPLFEYTKFSRMGWDHGRMVYYSAGIERPEYNGGIRIMSRHTRIRTILINDKITDYNWGSTSQDLNRGNATLTQSTKAALDLGYKDIWISREENPSLLKWFQKNSPYDWNITHQEIPKGGLQWVLRLV